MDTRPEIWEADLADDTVPRDPSEFLAIVEERGRLEQVLREMESAERAQRFLSEASMALSSSLDYGTTLNTVAHLAVPHIADWCIVEVVDADGELERLAAAHVDPAKEELARMVQERYPSEGRGDGAMRRVVTAGEAMIFSEITEEQLAAGARDEEHLRILREVGMNSVMIVPMMARGNVLGAITFIAAESGRRFESSDLELAQELARRAGVAVDNAHLYDAEQRARTAAELATTVRDEFLSVASHELKTPLTALQLQIQMLQRLQRPPSLDGNERAMGTLNAANRQVKRLARLVDELLDVSRIAAGRLAYEMEAVDLVEVVRDVIDRFESELQAAGCKLSFHEEGAVIGAWDRFRLDQVITNLLANAIKYGPGRPIEVTVEWRAGAARLTIRDHGIGIRPEDIGRIFDRFERLVPAQNYGGLGLGLHIAHEIVSAHGGTIEAESQPDEGATFVVSLPLESQPPVGSALLSE